MKTKIRVLKHRFPVLIFCVLLGSAAVIYAIAMLNSNYNKSYVLINESLAPSATPSNSVIPAENSTTDSVTGKSAKTTDNNSSSFSQPPASITISAVGDLMTHQGILNSAYSPKTGTYDFNSFLEYVKPYLIKSDLTIGNFETVTAGPASRYTSYPLFNTPDAMLTALSNAGFDVLSTANNHCLDRGIAGLTRTVEKIKENKMINIGSSIDGKNKYITKEIHGIKVSLLSYSSAFNGNDRRLSFNQRSKYLSPINETQIKNDIKAVKANGTDAVILIMHWGTEYQRKPNTMQTALSNKMISWGADVVLGSHPHVIQKSEIKRVDNKNKFIIYSMGNFISGYRRTDKARRPSKAYTEDGVIVQLKIEKNPLDGVIIKKADYIPTWVDKSYINKKTVFRIIPIPNANITGWYITNSNRKYIKQSYKNTMDIMTGLN